MNICDFEHSVEVSHISKQFGDTKAVVDVSFDVVRGEIFGLLGPNGAGKTTVIRIILDIFKPNRGSVSVLGGQVTKATKERIGYMPEERGLYQDITLENCLVYMGKLKGIPVDKIRGNLLPLLERFDLADHKSKKVKELSKGMQQKAQIINTILHEPELVIIDEPFTALDPLNLQLVKEMILELRDRGTTIIMSTHQMHQVEELCDRILLINNGRDVLYGGLEEIRKKFSGHAVLVKTREKLPHIYGVDEIEKSNGSYRMNLRGDTSTQKVLHDLISNNIVLEKFEIAVPALEEIFIRVVGGREAEW